MEYVYIFMLNPFFTKVVTYFMYVTYLLVLFFIYERIWKKRKNGSTYFGAWLQTSKQTFNKSVTSFGFKSLIWKKCPKLLFLNWTVMPRMVEHYQLSLQQKVLLFSLGQVILSFWKLWLFSRSDINLSTLLKLQCTKFEFS